MDQRIVKIVLVTVMSVMLVLTVVVNYLSTSAAGRSSGLFENKTNSSLPWTQRGNIKDSSLTPPGWAFIVWAVIYAYQAAMLAYSWSTLFRSDAAGEFVCCSPGLLPTAALVLHSVSSVFNIAWVFLADRADTSPGLLVPQTFVIFLLAACVSGAAGVGVAGVREACRLRSQQLLTEKTPRLSSCEIPLAIGLAVNANGFYAGWTVVASFLNADIANINMSGWPEAASGVLMLAQLVMAIAVYATLDLLVLRLHELHSPYVTTIWALATSAGGNFNAQSAATVLSIQLAVLLAVLLGVKVALAVRHVLVHRVQPLPIAGDGDGDGGDGEKTAVAHE